MSPADAIHASFAAGMGLAYATFLFALFMGWGISAIAKALTGEL